MMRFLVPAIACWVLSGPGAGALPPVAVDVVHPDPAGPATDRLDAICEVGWKDDPERPDAPMLPRGAAIPPPDFLDRRDLDGDGAADIVVRYSSLTCEGGHFAHSAFCGTAGCKTELWYAQAEGGYRLGLDAQIRDFRIVEHEGRTALELHHHGTSCGRVGASACSSIYAWDGTRLRALCHDCQASGVTK